MRSRALRSPRERVGTLPNADLPPPAVERGPSEALLRAALMEGDARAFEAVAEGLRPEMIRIAQRHVRSREDAEDVVQDTWMAALAGVRRFQGRASLRTWLLRILSYRARTAGRRAARQIPLSQLTRPGTSEPLSVEDRTPMFAGSAAQPDELLQRRELRARLEAGVAALPSRQRQVLTLRDVEGRPAAEVSRALGLTAGNQRVLLHRARQQVRQGLPEWWERRPRDAVA